MMVVFKWTKKAISVFIFTAVFLMPLFLSGCNIIDAASPAVKASTDSSEVSDTIKLEFWGISSEDNKNEEILEQLVNKFNTQNSKIHVNLDMKSNGYFYKIYSAAMASQTNPDVGMMFCSQAAQFCDRGFLFALDNIIKDIYYRGQRFYPNVHEQANLYKQYFGVPVSIQNMVLLARKDILREKGLSLPQNLTELLQDIRSLSNKERAGIALANKGYLSGRSMLYFILVNGGSIFDSGGSFKLGGEKNLQVYDFFHTLSKENLIYNKKSQLSVNDMTNVFTRGEAAFILTTPTTLDEIYNKTNKDFIDNVEILNLKGFDNIYYSSGPVYTQVLSVFKNSQHKEEAQVFVEWLSENYSELWPDYQYDEIPAINIYNRNSILNEKFTKEVFQSIIPSSRFPYYPAANSVNYIAIEGTDIINDFLLEISNSEDINAAVEKYQSIVRDWSVRFNR
jgi:ABC-type glycerol-3-phosphate transport system substrate-binding protein